MNDAKYIGLDVHQATISVAVLDSAGKLVMEAILETKAETIRYAPAIERPEMHGVLGMVPDVTQPRDPGVRGLCYRPLHIEMEHRFGCTCPQFRCPPPSRIAGTGGSVSATAIPNKINVDVLVGRPGALK